MRIGTGNACLLALLTLGFLAAGPSAATAEERGATTSSLDRAAPTGAAAAASIDIFTLSGAPQPNRIAAHLDPASGRLVLTSPEGIMAPASPGGECRQDASTQVSCAPGFIDVIAGDLGGGADAFSADRGLPVAIGYGLPGADRPLLGGGGRDRLFGGGGDDLILAGGGADVVNGGGGSDVLRGERGADKVKGAGAPDLVSGGGGNDRLNGGGGRDRCLGGRGRDSGRSCAERKGIP